MRREQIWCDQCGRLIQDKNVPKGSLDLNNTDKSWEIWTPESVNDMLFCSLLCLYHHAGNLLMSQEITNENEKDGTL